jgi:hypothetical protein
MKRFKRRNGLKKKPTITEAVQFVIRQYGPVLQALAKV